VRDVNGTGSYHYLNTELGEPASFTKSNMSATPSATSQTVTIDLTGMTASVSRTGTRTKAEVRTTSSLTPMNWFIAHQSGWDEILMFVIPIALAVFLVRRLERRAPRDAEPDQDESGSQ
jgi:hypothetical protein